MAPVTSECPWSGKAVSAEGWPFNTEVELLPIFYIDRVVDYVTRKCGKDTPPEKRGIS